MTGPGDGFVLAVDLGTSHTVAMLRWPDGRTRPILFDGQPLLPSAVFLDTEGRLHVGRDAQRLGHADPARIEPNPKRRIDDDGALLGDTTVPVADLLAALLGAVARETVATAGFLPPAVLTHPAAWGRRRRDVLHDALVRAGWPAETRVVPEPVAAARYFADVLRRPVPVGAAIAVFDFGGGTLDVAVVRNDGPGPDGRPRFEVAASGGADDLGGLDLDAALVDHLGKSLAGGEPDAWAALTDPRTLAQWRARRQFWEDVRGAKEMLSRSALAPVPVPGVEQAVHLTRDELEAAAGPLIRRGVTETAAVIKAAGLTPGELAGLFLVGGSSRVPLVARLLHADLGVAPTVLEQPELPVAEGATVAAGSSGAGRPLSGTTGAPAPEPGSVAEPPSTGQLDRTQADSGGWDTGTAASVPDDDVRYQRGITEAATPTPPDDDVRYQRGVAEAATPTPTPPTIPSQPSGGSSEAPPQQYAEPVDPWATGEAAAFGPAGPPTYAPSSGAPSSGGPSGGGPPGPSGGPGAAGTGPGAAAQQPWLASAEAAKGGNERSPAYRKKWVLIVAAGLVVVVGAGAALAWALWPGYRALDFQSLDRTPAVSIPAAGQFSSNFVDTTIIGDRAYYATETDEGVLGVVAAEASSGKKLWVSTEAGLATGWDQIVGLPDGLVAITDVDSGSDTKRLVVLDRESGQARWQHSMKGSDSVVLAGGNAIFLDTDGKRLVAMRIGDGGKAWELADPGGSSRVPALLSSSTTDDVSGPARVSGAPLAPDRDDDTRLLQVMGDRSARVIDARNGTVLTEPKADIADVDGAVVVHNGRVVVAEKSGETLRIMTYDLDGLANPKVIGQVGKDQRVERMSACGDDHVCWIETTSYDAKTSQVAGVNVADGGKIWRVAAPNAETLAAVGDNVLVNQGSQPARVMLVDATTGKAAWSGEGAGARLDGGNVLLFSRPLATSVEDPSLIGRHLGDKPVQLGPLTGVRTASCSWNTSAIACVADEDLRWQKIAS